MKKSDVGSALDVQARVRAIIEDYLLLCDDSMVAILPYALAIAARTGVADLVHRGCVQLDALSNALCVDSDVLYRLLRALVSCGLFEELPGRTFALTELGDVLRSDSWRSQRARLSNVDSYRAWLTAAEGMELGRPAFDRTFNSTFFDHKESDAAAGPDFDRRMRERSRRLYAELLARHDWRDSRCVMDVGGGIGVVLAAVLESASHLRGVLFDRPAVVEHTRRGGALAHVADRCSFASGDFFQALPGGADTHLLCSVLHDWDDERAASILRSSALALPPGGRLVVCELIVPESAEWHPAKWSDLGMMVVLGGRERTLHEFDRLLGAAGFARSRTVERPESPFALIEARRVEERVAG